MYSYFPFSNIDDIIGLLENRSIDDFSLLNSINRTIIFYPIYRSIDFFHTDNRKSILLGKLTRLTLLIRKINWKSRLT